jgi:hypothetical protein
VWAIKLAFRIGGDYAISMSHAWFEALPDSRGPLFAAAEHVLLLIMAFPKRTRKNFKDPIMKKLNSFLKTNVLRKFLPWTAKERYRPEKFYMRGPGPKAKAKDRDGSSVDCAPYAMPASDRRTR